MPELIDKAKVLKYLTPRIKTQTTYGEGYNKALEDSAELVALMPAIEAEPVRHGRWTDNGEDKFICSVCGGYVYRWFGKSDFCPNCGSMNSEV